MKIAKLIALAAFGFSASAFGQGTLTWATDTFAASQNTAFALVMDVNGTPLGTSFLGQIYSSPTANGTYVALGAALPFNNGGDPGYIFPPAPPASTLTAPNVAGGATGFYEMRAWNSSAGSTFEAASLVVGAHVGSSAPTSAVFGNPAASPPTVGPTVDTFASFSLHAVTAVPEPSTIALGIVGVAGLLALRRRQ
jgi:hypothetical protein